MEQNEVKRIINETVNATVQSLIRENMIKDSVYIDILRRTEGRLKAYYNRNQNREKVREILAELKDDEYIGIISMLYKDRMSIESIAEELGVNVSTVKRNKRRLIFEINRRWGGQNND